MNSTKITIENGNITFGRTGAGSLIASASDGDYMLNLEEWKRDMTWQQIKFVKGPLRKVYSDVTGYTIKESERRLKRMFGEVEHCEIDGEPCIELISFGDKRYNVERMSQFIDDCLHHMEYDLNVVIDPKVRKQWMLDMDTGEMEEIKP